MLLAVDIGNGEACVHSGLTAAFIDGRNLLLYL